MKKSGHRNRRGGVPPPVLAKNSVSLRTLRFLFISTQGMQLHGKPESAWTEIYPSRFVGKVSNDGGWHLYHPDKIGMIRARKLNED